MTHPPRIFSLIHFPSSKGSLNLRHLLVLSFLPAPTSYLVPSSVPASTAIFAPTFLTLSLRIRINLFLYSFLNSTLLLTSSVITLTPSLPKSTTPTPNLHLPPHSRPLTLPSLPSVTRITVITHAHTKKKFLFCFHKLYNLVTQFHSCSKPCWRIYGKDKNLVKMCRFGFLKPKENFQFFSVAESGEGMMKVYRLERSASGKLVNDYNP